LKHRKKAYLGFLSGGLGLLFALLNLGTTHAEGPKPPLKVGFILVGPANDLGWNTSHDQGRKYLESQMHGSVITTVAEKIPENEQVERIMERMIAQGNMIIFGTSYGYFEPAVKVAARHPDVHFLLCGRLIPKAPKNVGSCFARYYDPLYALGIVAGKLTKTNSIGFVLGHPVPNLLWCANALTLGARSVNPKAVVHVVWTNSWDDPATEAEATRGLIERGNDIIASNMDSSITVSKTCEKGNALSIGTHYDINQFVPNAWLGGQHWNWGPLYLRSVKTIQDGTWKPGNLSCTLQDGYVQMSTFGKVVPKGLQSEALAVFEQIKDGKKTVFEGPLSDRDGKLRLAKGQKGDAAWLDQMDWFVPGVEGTLPKK
jgi:basic membrane protein A